MHFLLYTLIYIHYRCTQVILMRSVFTVHYAWLDGQSKPLQFLKFLFFFPSIADVPGACIGEWTNEWMKTGSQPTQEHVTTISRHTCKHKQQRLETNCAPLYLECERTKNHHHVAIKELGHFLTPYGLKHPQVSSMVFLGSFWLLGYKR
jgi:hypothetical protein